MKSATNPLAPGGGRFASSAGRPGPGASAIRRISAPQMGATEPSGVFLCHAHRSVPDVHCGRRGMDGTGARGKTVEGCRAGGAEPGGRKTPRIGTEVARGAGRREAGPVRVGRRRGVGRPESPGPASAVRSEVDRTSGGNPPAANASPRPGL